MKKKNDSPVADVFVEIPEGFWIDDWFEECLSKLTDSSERQIIQAMISYRHEIAALESWGGFHTRGLLMTARGIALVTRIPVPRVLEILCEQTNKGFWSCSDVRYLDPTKPYYLSPRKFSPDAPVEE